MGWILVWVRILRKKEWNIIRWNNRHGVRIVIKDSKVHSKQKMKMITAFHKEMAKQIQKMKIKLEVLENQREIYLQCLFQRKI